MAKDYLLFFESGCLKALKNKQNNFRVNMCLYGNQEVPLLQRLGLEVLMSSQNTFEVIRWC